MLTTWESLQANTHLKIDDNDWLVVEQLQVSFESYYGALTNLPLQDVELKCTYLSNKDGECLVISFNNTDQSYKAYQGWWIDPMELA